VEFGNDNECIAEIVHSKANAKAISAVPDMIDALADIVQYMSVKSTSDNIRREKAIKALQKAGVEL
jgi:predicted GIY-YIG superfamily endonuclease